MKKYFPITKNHIKLPELPTNNNEKKYEIKQTNTSNKNKVNSYRHTSFKKSHKKNKDLNINVQNINNGLNVNIILGVTKREHKKTSKEEEQKIPKTSPYTFKYFCNTANKKGFSKALSGNNSIKPTNSDMESNFIKLSKDANVYTANANYITNMKLLLFDKYIFENNKYKPNRAKLFDMTVIPHSKSKNNTVYKTTKFRGGRMFFYDYNKKTTTEDDKRSKSNKFIININKKPLYLQELEKYELKTQYDFYEKNKVKNYVDYTYQSRKRHPPSNSLYKELVAKKNEIYDNLGKMNKNNKKCENNILNYYLSNNLI